MSNMVSTQTKLRLGNVRKAGKVAFKNETRNGFGPCGPRIYFQFGYWPRLNAEIKLMQGHHYHGFDETPRKIWSVVDSPRNRFQIDYMEGKDPYAHYDKPLVDFETHRELYDHQREMVAHALTRKKVVFACEMGSGKTLSFITLMEIVDYPNKDIWYVGPRSGVTAVGLELLKWGTKKRPTMMTYEGMVKTLKEWKSGDPAPKMLCFDESSKIKTPTSQRSQAALKLANAMRDEHGDEAYIILMSGTPAPKTPVDWWQQCEVPCPGFIREGTSGKFKMRLSITEMRENMISGGVYPHLVTWLDDENKCAECGLLKTDHGYDHKYIKSVNEVERLYKRMNGLVLVKFKKDCLDLPEKTYEVIRVKPTPDMLRAAKLIKDTAPRAITALTLLRELSDGFQYREVVSGQVKCPNCHGRKEVDTYVSKDGSVADPLKPLEIDYEIKLMPCDTCGASGEINTYTRDTDVVGSPKDQVYIQELDDHVDIGRYIVWGGFTGTLDRLVTLSHRHGWATLRIDGKGYVGSSAHGNDIPIQDLFFAMDRSHPKYRELLIKYPKLVIIGHPQAGGMAFTFTASPTELFYSNCFSGEARMQAEDRAHRPGMDENRGLVIKDLIMFKTDQIVLDNLKKKKKLQNLSMGQLADAFTSE